MHFVEGEIRELAEGVFLRAAVDNCLWADLGGGVVVVDALEDPGLAPVIEAEVRRTTGKGIRWVVNTHWDHDHIACNPAWARAGAVILAHEAAADATADRDGEPDITFSQCYTLDGGARRAEMEWVGGTHTPEDSLVHFPWARVLAVGDLFGWGLIPLRAITAGALDRLREVYARLLSYDAAVVVPGHGPTLEPAHLRRFREYLDDLTTRVPPLCRAGATPEQVEHAFPVPDDMHDWWRFAEWKHARNLEMVCAWVRQPG